MRIFNVRVEYVILAVAVVATAIRLFGPRGYFERQTQRMADPAFLLTQKIRVVSFFAGFIALAFVAWRDPNRPWLWLAAAIAFLSWLQIAALFLVRRPDAFVWVVRGIGAGFAVVTVMIYLVLLR